MAVTHGASQPTLEVAPDPPSAYGLGSLLLPELAALLALCRATRERAPTTPAPHFSQEMAAWLSGRKVIVLNPASADGVVHRAIYDPITWRFLWASASETGFEQATEVRIRAVAAQAEGLEQKVLLWRMLASAEIEGYMANQLRRHGFDPAWWVDVSDRGERWTSGRLSLAQMRYVVWASVREGASAYLRWNGDLAAAREAILQEIWRRSRWVETKPDWGSGFLPAGAGLQSIMLTIFLELVAPIGTRYWTQPPHEASLAP